MLTSMRHFCPNFDSLLPCLEMLKLSCFLPAKISRFRHLWSIPGQIWAWKEKGSQTYGPKQWGIDATVIRVLAEVFARKKSSSYFAWVRLEHAFFANQMSVLSSTYWLSCTELINSSPFLAFWISYWQKAYHNTAFWQNILVLTDLSVFNSKKRI